MKSQISPAALVEIEIAILAERDAGGKWKVPLRLWLGGTPTAKPTARTSNPARKARQRGRTVVKADGLINYGLLTIKVLSPDSVNCQRRKNR